MGPPKPVPPKSFLPLRAAWYHLRATQCAMRGSLEHPMDPGRRPGSVGIVAYEGDFPPSFGQAGPVQRQVFAAVVRRLTLGISVDINNPFPRMGKGLSSWTKCRGSCQPDGADRPRDLVLVQSMYVGKGCPCLVVANPRNVPSEWSHQCSRTHSAGSG